MTAVCTTFICNAKIGFGLPMDMATCIGAGLAVLFLLVFLWRGHAMPDNPFERQA